jgi:arginase
VLGGDCSLLPGAIAGCRAAGTAPALWILDGHPDMLDGDSSPTGEAADMDLAVLLADGLVAAEHVVVLGLRPAGHDPENDAELAAIPASVTWRDTDAIRARGAGATGAEAERRLAADPGAAWLHLDVDVLDAAVMSAVTYRQSHGLSWDALAELLAPLVRSPALAGMSVSDLEADRDADGSIARRVVALLAGPLADEPAGVLAT